MEEELLRRFPDAPFAANDLGVDFTSRREYARADSLFRREIVRDSFTSLPRSNLIRSQLSLGRVVAARSIIAAARARIPKSAELELMEAPLLYAEGRVDSATVFLRRMRGSRFPRNRVLAARALAALAIREGRLAEGVRLLGEASAENATGSTGGSALEDSVTVSLIDAWLGARSARAVQRLDAVLAQTPLRSLPVDNRGYFSIASVYAMAGRPDRARAVLAQYDAEVRDTTLRRWFEPYQHQALTEIALAEKRPRDAIDEARRGDMRPDGPVEGCPICVFVSLGRAFDQAGVPDSAIAMLEHYVSSPYPDRFELRCDGLHLAAVYKRLGELYEARGDRAKAASYDAKLVELWKNADPELQPTVRAVRDRLVRLSDIERR